MASAFSETLWSGLRARKATIPRCHLIPKATLTQADEKKIGYFENRFTAFALSLGRRTAVHWRISAVAIEQGLLPVDGCHSERAPRSRSPFIWWN